MQLMCTDHDTITRRVGYLSLYDELRCCATLCTKPLLCHHQVSRKLFWMPQICSRQLYDIEDTHNKECWSLPQCSLAMAAGNPGQPLHLVHSRPTHREHEGTGNTDGWHSTPPVNTMATLSHTSPQLTCPPKSQVIKVIFLAPADNRPVCLAYSQSPRSTPTVDSGFRLMFSFTS